MINQPSFKYNSKKRFTPLKYIFKWGSLAVIIGALVGSATAFFLISLDWATNTREKNPMFIAFLPIGGLAIGLLYYYVGRDVVKGNNLLLEEAQNPTEIIPLQMAPLVYVGTIITHLVGGSAGREGTAMQMGGAIADQFTKWYNLDSVERKIIITMGISAGFAAVFGTPFAGAIFALEILVLTTLQVKAILPSILVAIIANYLCDFWNVKHTQYTIASMPSVNISNIMWMVVIGIACGLAALLFSKITHLGTHIFASTIPYPPFRPMIAGLIIAIVIWQTDTKEFIGLGIPFIQQTFIVKVHSYDFFIKMLFTAFTIGAGFKGGEVTPLFFIGAALGNAMVWFIPLPLSLLAAVGFVSIFAGATHTPIASTIMGMEIFGNECAVFIAVACVVSYFCSGNMGIYTSQLKQGPKYMLYHKLKHIVLG